MRTLKNSKKTPKGLADRQRLICRWLMKAGIPEGILAIPHPELDEAFCQVRADRLRQVSMIRALVRLQASKRQGTRL